jgi:hypothetical protein
MCTLRMTQNCIVQMPKTKKRGACRGGDESGSSQQSTRSRRSDQQSQQRSQPNPSGGVERVVVSEPRCVLCGEVSGLTALGSKGIQTLLQMSLNRGDELHSTLHAGRKFHIHEACRQRYKRGAMANTATVVSSDGDAPSTYDTGNVVSGERPVTPVVAAARIVAKTVCCIICGESAGFLTSVGNKGLANLMDISANRGEKLHTAVDYLGNYKIHESCRRQYCRREKIDNVATVTSCTGERADMYPASQLSSASAGDFANAGCLVEVRPGAELDVKNCGQCLSHHEYLVNVARVNGLTFTETVGGGDCLFDAVRYGLVDFGVSRTITELRLAASLELDINAPHYRPLYVVDDHGQNVQARTYEEFVRRTRDGAEWATNMTVAAMAKALDVVIRVISTDRNSAGETTAWVQNFGDGVTRKDMIITVGFNKQSAHYSSLRTSSCSAIAAADPSPEKRSHQSAPSSDIHRQDVPTSVDDRNDDDVFEDLPSVVLSRTTSTLQDDVEPDDTPMSISGRASCSTRSMLTSCTRSMMSSRTRSMLSSCPEYPMDLSAEMSAVELGVVPCTSGTHCENCLRCETPSVQLFVRECSSSFTARHISLVQKPKPNKSAILCRDCCTYLQVFEKSSVTDMWVHGWPAAIAYMLQHRKYSHIRRQLWELLPDIHRESWQLIGAQLSMVADRSTTGQFEDVTSRMSRYEVLTTSGVVGEFITAMTEFSFPCVKCPAGCFAYVDECDSVSFKHFIAWKFGVSVFNGAGKLLTGARTDWPTSSLLLDKFHVRPSVVVNEQGLCILLCKSHGKALRKPMIHVPRNPLLGDLGYQSPDTTAAAVLTPNVVRAGRMGKWTHSSHVINAVGGYSGISSSSIAQRVDMTIKDERLAAAQLLSATNRSDVMQTVRQRYLQLVNGQQQLEFDLRIFNQFLKPSNQLLADCLRGGTVVYAQDAFNMHNDITSRDSHQDPSENSESGESRDDRRRTDCSFTVVHQSDEHGCCPIDVGSTTCSKGNLRVVDIIVPLLIHCQPLYRRAVDQFAATGNEYVGRLLGYAKKIVYPHLRVLHSKTFHDAKEAEESTCTYIETMGVIRSSTLETSAQVLVRMMPSDICYRNVSSVGTWRDMDWSAVDKNIVILYTESPLVDGSDVRTTCANHRLLGVFAGDHQLPDFYFRWHHTGRFWKVSGRRTSQLPERTEYGGESGSVIHIPKWSLLIYVVNSSVDDMNHSLCMTLQGQDKMRCELHDLFLCKQSSSCRVVCAVRNCERFCRWQCTGKGEFCTAGVCLGHGKRLLQGDVVVNVVEDMEGDRLSGAHRQVAEPSVTEDVPEPVVDDDSDSSNDAEDNEEIFAPIGMEDPADASDAPALHSRRDLIPIYDVQRSIAGHFMWNKGYGVLRRRMDLYSNVDCNAMLQHIVSMTNDACVSLLYPEGQLFPRIFWSAKEHSVIGAIPSFMLNCSDEKKYGLASLAEHHAIRIRDGNILTSRENGYWHYMFDVMLNSRLNRCSSKLVFKRGVEFILEESSKQSPGSFVNAESKMPMDEAEATRRVKELASLLKKDKWTYFVTLTVNDTETPGIREITRAINSFAGDDETIMSELIDAYLPFMLRSWERFVRVLLRELLMRNSQIIGKVKEVFYRFEFQGAGAKGNKPHVHAGITLESESEEVTVGRICCSSLEFASVLYGTDFRSLYNLGIVGDERDFNQWCEVVSFVQKHDCERVDGRCKKVVNAAGEKICRYRRQPPLPIPETGGWFECIDVNYSDEVYTLLEELQLARREFDVSEQRVRWWLHESLRAGKWHYRARSDEFFLASIPLLSSITRSATNVDMCDRHFQTSYLVKYIAGKEEHQLVDVSGSKDISEVRVTTEEHGHEKIAGCRKILEAREKLQPHLGREMSLAEVVWFILGFPYTYCTANFVHVPTLPIDSRGTVAKYCTMSTSALTAADERRVAELPYWRQFTANQEAHIEEYTKSSYVIDTTSAFNVRAPELLIFDSLTLYSECFTRQGHVRCRRFSQDISAEGWIDGTGRAVKVWSCSVNKCVNFLQAKFVSGILLAQVLLEQIFWPLQRGCPVLCKRFVVATDATQIVSVISHVKPWDRTKFLTHVCLSEGTYKTEMDMFAVGSIKEALFVAGLLPSSSVVERNDVLRIMRRYIVEDVAFHPITCRQFGKFVLAAMRTLMDVLVHDVQGIYTPCISEIMLKDQATQQLLELERLRRLNLIQGLGEDPIVSSLLPPGIEQATPDAPLLWTPTINVVDGVSESAVDEQCRALAVCTRAIDWFVNPACRGLKFPCLVGRPGSGKSHVLKLSCAYALSKGLQVELMSFTSERARKLGGSHLHLVFPFNVSKGSASVTQNIAHDCLKRLDNDPLRKLLIRRTDIFLFEEIGLLSAQMFCAVDLVLQMVMGNSLPWGRKLLISSGDAKQLPPVSGQPLWSSVHMCTEMNVIMFTEDVRARDPELRWLNGECRRQLNADEAGAVADMVLTQCAFVPDWNHVPDNAVRIVSTRAAENEIMEEFLSSKQTTEYIAVDEVQNNTTWSLSDQGITNRLNKVCYEYERCRLFVGAIVRMTYNDRRSGSVIFSQGQVGVVTGLGDGSLAASHQRLTIRLAAPGVREFDVHNIPDHWPEIIIGRRTTPAILVGRCLQMGRRTQFPVRYHLTSTIHRIQGDTVSFYATQVSTVNRQYRLWQKEQFAVLISRAEHCRDIMFVGSPSDTKSAIVNILTQSSKWDVIIDAYMSALDVMSQPRIREINLDVHPFKPMYRELPTASCGYIYLLCSIAQSHYCYLGECDNLRQSLRRHNTGYGDEQTQPTHLHPWGVFAFICGFEADDDVTIGQQRRHDFLLSLPSAIGVGPETVYGSLRDQVADWHERGMTSLVIVKCGSLGSAVNPEGQQ